MSQPSAEKQFAGFLSKYDPEIRQRAVEAIATMRERVPGAIELVYDNYNALVVGFGPSERASEAIFSIALYPRWVTLFFLDGVGLPDPQKLLKGAGKVVRHIVLDDAAALNAPAVRALMKAAIKQSEIPIKKGQPRMVIKSISAKQRPRRPAAK